MDALPAFQQDMLIDKCGPSSLVFLLKRVADYLQQECYAEVGCILSAYAQLEHGQTYFVEILNAFVQGYANYQHTQKELLEISTRLIQARTDLQKQGTRLIELLPGLIQDLETLSHSEKLEGQRREVAVPQSRQGSLIVSADDPMHGATLSLPDMYITCFSRFEVRHCGKVLMLCSNRAGQAILRYLVTKSGRSATSDTLKALFWPEEEPEAAQRKLHHAISALRTSLNQHSSPGEENGYIVCKNGLYSLNSAAVRIHTDVDDFLSYYQAAQQKSEDRVAFYEKACALYTGPFLIEDIYADWSALQREQLSRTYFAMCRVLTEHYLCLKRYEDATRWAMAMLKENPCDETSHQQLIQIYAAQGNRSAAIRQYQQCERTLREELGIGPMLETSAILQKSLTCDTEQRRSKNGEHT